MIKIFTAITVLVFLGSVAISADLPDSSELPRMPDAYRGNDYKDLSKRNPFGMSIYDVAEREAENEYSETVVVPLEESRRILNERKKIAKEQENKGLNVGGSK
jgi:hypothetical protein